MFFKQIRKHSERKQDVEEESLAPEERSEEQQALIDDSDDLLASIDEALEVFEHEKNFAADYTQRGGQ